ncbi:PadR family transcriptional regulator [Vibrio sp. PP-XX7]
MKLANLPIVLLNQLKKEPMTGYDLNKLVEEHGWPASHQQVYRELNKLNTMNLVSYQDVPQEGKPDKKVYQLTVAGAEELKKVTDAVPSIPKLRDEVMVHLILENAAYFPRLIASLAQEIIKLQERKANVTSKTQALMIDRHIARLEADAQWAQEVGRLYLFKVKTEAA